MSLGCSVKFWRSCATAAVDHVQWEWTYDHDIYGGLRGGGPKRLPSLNEVDGEEEGSAIVWRFPERTSWLRM